MRNLLEEQATKKSIIVSTDSNVQPTVHLILIGKKKLTKNSKILYANIPWIFINVLGYPKEVYVILRHEKLGYLPLGYRKISAIRSKTGVSYYVRVPKEIIEFLKIFNATEEEFEIYVVKK